jgi:hypothetical protein
MGAGCSPQLSKNAAVNPAAVPAPAAAEPAATTPAAPDTAQPTETAMVKTDAQVTGAMVAKAPVATGLRAEIEAAYTVMVATLAAGNKTEFFGMIDSAALKRMPTDEEWKQALPFLQDSYPDLKKTSFLSLENKDSQTVYYYFLSELQDAKYVTVNVLIFNKATGKWKVSGNIFSSSFARPADKKQEDKKIADTIVELRAKADKR